jgi:hypothetical protein
VPIAIGHVYELCRWRCRRYIVGARERVARTAITTCGAAVGELEAKTAIREEKAIADRLAGVDSLVEDRLNAGAGICFHPGIDGKWPIRVDGTITGEVNLGTIRDFDIVIGAIETE